MFNKESFALISSSGMTAQAISPDHRPFLHSAREPPIGACVTNHLECRKAADAAKAGRDPPFCPVFDGMNLLPGRLSQSDSYSK